MAHEIEHKFLIQDDSWRLHVFRSVSMRQGYLVSDEVRSVRVRIAGNEAHLNIKSGTLGTVRSEYEYAIPLDEAEEILNRLCQTPLLEKTRHFVRHDNHVWEVDVFEGDNAGLVVAEVELSTQGEEFSKPSWVGEDVSHDMRYYNSSLVHNPYKNWR